MKIYDGTMDWVRLENDKAREIEKAYEEIRPDLIKDALTRRILLQTMRRRIEREVEEDARAAMSAPKSTQEDGSRPLEWASPSEELTRRLAEIYTPSLSDTIHQTRHLYDEHRRQQANHAYWKGCPG